MTLQAVSSIVIAIIIVLMAAGLLCVVCVAAIGFVKIRQAWAELLKDQEHRDE